MTTQWYYVRTKSMQMLRLVSFVSLSNHFWLWNVYATVYFYADFDASGMRPKAL